MLEDAEVTRHLRHREGTQQLRIWWAGRQPTSTVDTAASVEWMGTLGHPTSYAMLGGHLVRGGTTAVNIPPGAWWHGSLTGEPLELSLPEQYLPGVRQHLHDGVMVTIAAHHPQCSSAQAFRWVTKFLGRILTAGMPAEEETLWAMWGQIRDDRR